MKVKVLEDAHSLGQEAANLAAKIINEAIEKKGKARIVLSTGASQFETIEALIKTDVDWSKVEMFHLDEYVNLPESHIASFRKYLKERFISNIPLGKAYLVNGEENLTETIQKLTADLRKEPVDLGLIGIGENAHIAFNDPPANFETKEAYIVVNLDEDCKKQQVREGWFNSLEEVPKQAISMTVHQILQCETIISCVPHQAKAKAIKALFTNEVTNIVPATILKTHPQIHLFLDENSASEVKGDLISKYI